MRDARDEARIACLQPAHRLASISQMRLLLTHLVQGCIRVSHSILGSLRSTERGLFAPTSWCIVSRLSISMKVISLGNIILHGHALACRAESILPFTGIQSGSSNVCLPFPLKRLNYHFGKPATGFPAAFCSMSSLGGQEHKGSIDTG